MGEDWHSLWAAQCDEAWREEPSHIRAVWVPIKTAMSHLADGRVRASEPDWMRPAISPAPRLHLTRISAASRQVRASEPDWIRLARDVVEKEYSLPGLLQLVVRSLMS